MLAVEFNLAFYKSKYFSLPFYQYDALNLDIITGCLAYDGFWTITMSL